MTAEQGQQLPVTVVISRRPKPGMDDELIAWAEGVSSAAAQFPGHLGRTIHPPSADRPELLIVFSFRTSDELAAWESSDVRAGWLERGNRISEGGHQHAHALTGFESIFSPSVGATKAPPPRWKTGTIIAIALFPLSLLLNLFVTPFVPVPGNTFLDALIRVTVNVLIIVPYMVYLAMPRLTKALRSWLHP